MVISRPGVRSKEEEGIPLDFNALVRSDSCDLQDNEPSNDEGEVKIIDNERDLQRGIESQRARTGDRESGRKNTRGQSHHPHLFIDS